jgi:hypothetical protein
MPIRYICTTYDEYNPQTGFYVLKQDCIEWNEDLLGPYAGTTYATQQECYDNSVCSQQPNSSTNSVSDNLNNWCGISITNVSLLEKTNNNIKVLLETPEIYYNTYIEYSLNNGNSFLRINLNNNNIVEQSNILHIDIDHGGSGGEVCSLIFRLVTPCEIGSESGSESGGGSESGSDSGGKSGIDNSLYITNASACYAPYVNSQITEGYLYITGFIDNTLPTFWDTRTILLEVNKNNTGWTSEDGGIVYSGNTNMSTFAINSITISTSNPYQNPNEPDGIGDSVQSRVAIYDSITGLKSDWFVLNTVTFDSGPFC